MAKGGGRVSTLTIPNARGASVMDRAQRLDIVQGQGERLFPIDIRETVFSGEYSGDQYVTAPVRNVRVGCKRHDGLAR